MLRRVLSISGVVMLMASPFVIYGLTVSQDSTSSRGREGTVPAVEASPSRGARAALLVYPAPVAPPPVAQVSPASVRVKVFNGGAPPGTARSLTRDLAARGFAVSNAANFNGPRMNGLVLYHRGDQAKAAIVSEALGGRPSVLPMPGDLAGEADVVLIVGPG